MKREVLNGTSLLLKEYFMTLLDKSLQLTDVQKAFDAGNQSSKEAFQASVSQVSSVNSKAGAVTLAKGDVGLGNVDNTSDANKPVSTAQATAIGAKMDATLPALQAVFDGGTAAQKSAFQASVSGDVSAVAASRSLASDDDGDRLHCAAGITVTVPSGLGSKFGCAIYGPVTVAAGSGVTLTDQRVSGAANPICAIEPTPTANVYLLIGSAA